MWALGVMFFFMLNADYPFSKFHHNSELKPHLYFERRGRELRKLAKDFSYKAAVENSRVKNFDSCTK